MLPYLAFCLKYIKRRINVGGGRALNKRWGGRAAQVNIPWRLRQEAQGREGEDYAF